MSRLAVLPWKAVVITVVNVSDVGEQERSHQYHLHHLHWKITQLLYTNISQTAVFLLTYSSGPVSPT